MSSKLREKDKQQNKRLKVVQQKEAMFRSDVPELLYHSERISLPLQQVDGTVRDGEVVDVGQGRLMLTPTPGDDVQSGKVGGQLSGGLNHRPFKGRLGTVPAQWIVPVDALCLKRLQQTVALLLVQANAVARVDVVDDLPENEVHQNGVVQSFAGGEELAKIK